MYTTIFLEPFSGTDGDRKVDSGSLIEPLGQPCDVHCLLRIQKLLERKPVEEEWQGVSDLDLEEDDDVDEEVENSVGGSASRV